MTKSTLFSIGHGNRTFDEFVKLLQNNGIKYLIDVRTIPYSKIFPQYNKETFESLLRREDITYVYLGDKLGGMPPDQSCYGPDGEVFYNTIIEKDFFKEGLERLIKANESDFCVVFMCSELKPENCHRSKLIGKALKDNGIIVNHIDEKGNIKDQFEVINIATKGLGDTDLFGNREFTSRKKYK